MTAPPAGRLTSLDAFRGLAIAGMILVNNPGSWSHIYAPLEHAEWHGVTPTDLVFPFFLFAIGVSMPFSFASRRRRGASNGDLTMHALRRAAILYGLGFVMAFYPLFDLANVRLTGVLARIALCYALTAPLVIWLSRRAVAVVGAVLLIGYPIVLSLGAAPGFPAGDLSPEGNLAGVIDRAVLGAHMWQGAGGAFDPEGLLGTFPAVATVLIGLFVGDYLREEARGVPKAIGIVAAGSLLIGTGLLWATRFPLNKALWTSSYVLYTGGWAMVTLAALHWLIDVRGWRAWSKPLVVYGVNAITVFVASGLVAKTLVYWRVARPDGDTTSMYTRIYEVAFVPWAGPLNGSLGFAITTVLLWLAAMWALYRRDIVIKV